MEGSIHRAPWPNVAEFGDAIEGADPELAGLAAQVLQEVRRTKTEARTGMRTPVRLLQITASADDAERLELVRDDLTDAGVIEDLTIAVEADQPQLVAHAELVVDKPH